MEGRDHHPTVANDGSDHPLVLSQSLPPPPTSRDSYKNTYIVQIPRDQIYRVPPPENSKIVETFRILPRKQKRRCSPLWWILVVTLMLILIGGGIMLGYYLLYMLKAPTFAITNFIVKNTTHGNLYYEVSFIIANPNERMSLSYEDGGTISLLYKEKTIGEGRFHRENQGAKESSNAYPTVAGSKTTVPSHLEKIMEEKKVKAAVGLSLAINVPIKLKGLISISKDLKVKCYFMVSDSDPGTKISSQNCHSEIHD